MSHICNIPKFMKKNVVFQIFIGNIQTTSKGLLSPKIISFQRENAVLGTRGLRIILGYTYKIILL